MYRYLHYPHDPRFETITETPRAREHEEERIESFGKALVPDVSTRLIPTCISARVDVNIECRS